MATKFTLELVEGFGGSLHDINPSNPNKSPIVICGYALHKYIKVPRISKAQKEKGVARHAYLHVTPRKPSHEDYEVFFINIYSDGYRAADEYEYQGIRLPSPTFPGKWISECTSLELDRALFNHGFRDSRTKYYFWLEYEA